MESPSNTEADAKVSEALDTLREIQKLFAKVPDRDLPFVTPVSHVSDYQNDPERLKTYGSQIIGTRSIHFAMINAIKAYWNIQMYLDGIITGSFFALPAAARGQIELFATAWHVYDIVVENAGFDKPDLAKRMRTIDEAFIMAIHGTREGKLIDFFRTVELSNLRPTNARDNENFKAKNILTRIEKAEGNSKSTNCLEDYERLSDFLHPNGLQNMVLTTPSERGKNWFHLALKHPQHLRRAQYQSVHAMVHASFEIMRLVSDVPDPFGPPMVTLPCH